MKTIFNENFTKENNNLFHLQIDGKTVYYKEIIHPTEFVRLYKKEKLIFEVVTKINTDAARPFVSLTAQKCKLLNIDKGSIMLIRLCKENKEAEFVTKVYEWGILRIPQEIINILNIKNKENINVKMIAKDSVAVNRSKSIDLAGIVDYNKGVKVILRSDDFITIYHKRCIPITLSRFIVSSPELIELFFLVHGDGHYKSKLYFVNKFPSLHKFVLDTFENIFRLPKNAWRYRILLHDLGTNDDSKEYWTNSLGLKESQFYNTSKSNLKTCPKGNLRIIIDKTLFSLIFRFVFDKIKSNIDKETSFNALNGLLCAEGGAQVSDVGLHKITLSFNQQEKELFKRIMCKADIFGLFKEEQNSRFVIQGWGNLYLFLKTSFSNGVIPFKIHYERKEKAVNGFLNHSFTKTMVKYLTAINKNDNSALEKLSKLLDIRRDSVLNTLRKEQYSDFIKISGKGINRNPFTITITEEGLDFLKFIAQLKNFTPCT